MAYLGGASKTVFWIFLQGNHSKRFPKQHFLKAKHSKQKWKIRKSKEFINKISSRELNSTIESEPRETLINIFEYDLQRIKRRRLEYKQWA